MSSIKLEIHWGFKRILTEDFKGAKKLYLTHYGHYFIEYGLILFFSFGKLIFLSFCAFCVYCLF